MLFGDTSSHFSNAEKFIFVKKFFVNGALSSVSVSKYPNAQNNSPLNVVYRHKGFSLSVDALLCHYYVLPDCMKLQIINLETFIEIRIGNTR